MARKITSGTVGRQLLGSIIAEDNTLRSVVTNEDIELTPNGTGRVVSSADVSVNSANGVRFYDTDSSNYVKIKAPGTVATDFTLTLPTSAGTSGYVLISDGSGNLSWDDIRFEISNVTLDPGPYYPMMTTSSSGTVTAVSVTTGGLSFNPTTGTLSATTFSGAHSGNLTGNVTGNLTGNVTGSVTGNITSTGTSTFSTIDCNGGNIDGTTIGSAAAAAGTFTTLSATSITETSSIALKENVSPITNALDAITKLVGVTYDRKDGSSTNEAGLIKEEVEKVLPNLVKDDGIYYTKLTAYLIEAVKELTKEIEILKGNK